MFGIGYQEMFIILVVALVIFGPSRLPEMAGQVGRWVRDFRRMSADLTGEFNQTFAEVEEVKRSIKREMRAIQDEVEGVGKSVSGDLKRSPAKPATGAKKATAGALKAGSTTGTAGRASASSAVPGKTAAANGAKAKSASRASKRNGKKTELDLAALPVATKADPLADVSFFDLDVELDAASNGAAGANGAAADGQAAVERVRKRRVSSAYGRRAVGQG
jgi:Tat protein translocase TatB subunit